ncbi:MAG: long-chain-fatty-acid--CoA ligase [Gammaproteobacteria bacterium]|nr:long-chain-fatty-acid--CoA ligase [Gammaproteobacteria bacterium]
MIRQPDFIRKHAFQTPDKIATHCEGIEYSWSEFNARIHQMAAALLEQGVKPGDRIAYLGMNSHWMVEMYFAPSLIGAISVPLNYRLSENELTEIIQDCTPRLLYVDRHFATQAITLKNRCDASLLIVYADIQQAEPDFDAIHYEQLITDAGVVADDSFDSLSSASDETMSIFYTSGTTGKPKGVMLSHGNMFANAKGTGQLYQYQSSDIMLLAGPLFHLGTGSRIFTAVLYGTTMVIQPKFDVENMMKIIESQSVTATTLVPTMFQMIIDHPRFHEFDFSSLRCLTYGSAPMTAALMKRVIDKFPGATFCQGYGMTEASPCLAVLTPLDHTPVNGEFPKLGSNGKPVRYCDLRIVDENDKSVPNGQSGEVIVRGPQIMNGYWNQPQVTAEAMRGGFYHTGDAGYLDKDGYLHLIGRTKEMIITGGENVYPLETESCLTEHPAVAVATVMGLPHKKWGEMVFAAVTLKQNKTATEQELIDFCREKIAHYKAPKRIKFWPGSLPLAATNKVDKPAIKAFVLEEGYD